MKYSGIAVSDGCAAGVAHVLSAMPDFENVPVTGMTVSDAAIAVAEATHRAMEAANEGDPAYELYEVQLMMLEDEEFLRDMERMEAEGLTPALAAINAANARAKMLEELDDEYLSARADDVREIGLRIACKASGCDYPSLSELPGDVIVIADELLPSVLMNADRKKILAIAAKKGARTSHVCILASAMAIPMIVACDGTRGIKSGERVFVDGTRGILLCDMTKDEEAECQSAVQRYKKDGEELSGYIGRETVTLSGERISLSVNITEPSLLTDGVSKECDGVGLYRTEFMYMDRSDLPGEEEQFRSYREAAQKLCGKPLVIRTMDIGGDKEARCLPLEKEDNPFMGFRAIRICMKRRDIMLTQLRAILRAAKYGDVRVMFPMIATVPELREMLGMINEARNELAASGIEFGCVKTGIMVEIPSAAVIIDRFLPYVDFVSIGSNDLTQYTLAADRMNPRVAYLYDFADPAVLGLISRVITHAKAMRKECSLCGEMASDPLGISILLTLGLEKASVSPSKLLRTRRIACMLDVSRLRESRDTILSSDDARGVREKMEALLPDGILR